MPQPDKPNRPDIHVAPPLVFIAGFGAAVIVDRLIRPWRMVDRETAASVLAIVGVALGLLGVALAIWGVVTFRAASTSVLPFRPATALVRRGPYRFTRNPMYVGMTLGYAGMSVVLNTWWPLLLLPLVLSALVRLVVSREEAYLTTIFGADYRDYTRSVRRWL
jgi:protein-S-isoprenylcysteine O-methyltransferase Ste14